MSSTSLPSFYCIMAATPDGGIGHRNRLPWHIPADMAFFRHVTTAVDDQTPLSPSSPSPNVVIMGRRTWESLPERHRPLVGRTNVVLSRRGMPTTTGVRTATSLTDALRDVADTSAEKTLPSPLIFVMGGAELFAEALRSPLCQGLYLTTVHAHPDEIPCDTFVPEVRQLAELGYVRERALEAHVHQGWVVDMTLYRRSAAARQKTPPPAPAPVPAPRHEEHQYLDLCRDILARGDRRADRTGTGTLSLFGATMRFSLRGDVFPLLTTKRTFFRGVAEELLWFIRGDTNAGTLRDKGIHIWDANGSRAYLDSLGLTAREEMDLGPVYGFQWRHFGARYTDMHADYRGQGVDQLAAVVRALKENPTDRRIVLSAWNPAALPEMALPPCHMFCQFYVGADGAVSCQMYQRSADMGLGVPFNIASYALLTRLVAHACGRPAGELVHVLGDAHIYTNHVDAIREQLQREPRPFPTLRIDAPEDTPLDEMTYAQLRLDGYQPHAALPMKMAV